jgi:hypothetical protein
MDYATITEAEQPIFIAAHDAGEVHALRELFLHATEAERPLVKALAQRAGYSPEHLFEALEGQPVSEPQS